MQKGDVGTVAGPCDDSTAADKADRVLVVFDGDKGRMNMSVKTQIERL
jgi:hypothetical protein